MRIVVISFSNARRLGNVGGNCKWRKLAVA
jgi:hypothetical protein